MPRPASAFLPRVLAALLGAGTLACALPAMAQQPVLRSQVATEARVQAAYLLKFPAYVEWPAGRAPQPPSASVIGVVNADDVAEELQRIAARMAPEARPTIKTLRAGDTLAGLHMLYLGGDDWPRYQRWVQQASSQSVLLVSSHAGALDEGSMINFRLVGDRVRFEVSMAAAERASLRIGAALLALAVTVERGR
jgi:hypothetical protein